MSNLKKKQNRLVKNFRHEKLDSATQSIPGDFLTGKVLNPLILFKDIVTPEMQR